jgi:hypothetical protein
LFGSAELLGAQRLEDREQPATFIIEWTVLRAICHTNYSLTAIWRGVCSIVLTELAAPAVLRPVHFRSRAKTTGDKIAGAPWLPLNGMIAR